MPKQNDIEKILTRGVESVIVAENLAKRLSSGKKLRVKLGIDPTAPDIHLGHSVVLRKLRQFQNAGHKAVLIIGDFTAQVGDPSGRDTTRPVLSEKDIKKNLAGYLKQAGKIIAIEKAEIRHNSEWHAKKGLAHLLSIAKAATVQQILKREDFQKRLAEDSNISLLETLYPILQGYDSVAVKADVELGGTDQTFNVLMGRRIQRHFEMQEQDIMTVPLLEGTDGIKKMSKSVGNYISLSETPKDMFGKIMSVPDSLVGKYFTLLTDIEPPSLDPYLAKRALAEEVVRLYHGEKKAKSSAEEFSRVFSKHEMPSEMPSLSLPKEKITLIEVLVLSGLSSKSEARRLIEQGGVQLNQETMEKDDTIVFSEGDILKIGKKKFFKIKIK
jgi:tyrosyl-tRNA synthetase